MLARARTRSYFLIQTALAWWPAVSPYDPWGATVALAFVLFVSGVKAVWEDWKRHRADWATNARTTRVMCGDGAFRRVPWRAVRVGDVVMTCDEEVRWTAGGVCACASADAPCRRCPPTCCASLPRCQSVCATCRPPTWVRRVRAAWRADGSDARVRSS